MCPVDWQISLPAVPAALPVARRFCWLFFAGTAGATDAELIASELSTLAVRHEAAAFAIRARRTEPGQGRIEVRDSSDGIWTRHLPPEEWPTPGLGLMLLVTVTDRAGHESDPIAGQLVWAEFSWTPASSEQGVTAGLEWDIDARPRRVPADHTLS